MKGLFDGKVWRWLSSERGAVAVALMVAVVRFASRVPTWFDLTISDDSDYMYFGVHFFDPVRTGQSAGDWAPLYRLWFYGLSRWIADTAILYYAAIILMGVLIPWTAYMLLRRWRRPPWFAGLVAVWLLIHYLTWFPQPHVGLFAVEVLLLVWWVSLAFPHRWQRWVSFAAGSLLVAYVRPEFFLTTVIATVVAAVEVFFQWRREKALPRPGWALGAVVLLGGGLWLWWGAPVSHARSVYAFGQHFAANAACLQLDWARGLHWEEIFQREFGAASTLGQAVQANPLAVLRHMLCNGRTFLRVLPLDRKSVV